MSLRGLHAQLLLWTILPLMIILVVTSVIGVNAHQQAMRQMVAERDGVLASVVASDWSEVLADRARDLQTTNPSRASFAGGIATFDTAGRIVRAEPSREVWESRRALLAPLLQTNRPGYSVPFSENGTPHLLVAVNVSDTIVIGAFTLPSSQAFNFGSRGVVYVVDASGHIIYHADSTQIGRDLSAHAGISNVMRGQTGVAFHHTPNNAELVVGYAPIAPLGWGVIVEEPWEDVITPMLRYSLALPIVILTTTVIALLAIFFGVRYIVRPLQALDAQAHRLVRGDFTATAQPVGGVHEIEALRQTLNQMAERVQHYQAAMRSYIGAITRGQEDERKRLARELHDDTTQALIALAQRIELTQKALTRDPAQATTRLAELKTMTATTIENVRRFTRDLRPLYLEDLGLVTALEMLINEMKARADVTATLQITGEPQRLSGELELALFRIAQEALNNVAQHARAKQVVITLDFQAKVIRLRVEDDGIGFAAPASPNQLTHDGHFGLMGMQERVLLFGGQFVIRSAAQRGTCVEVSVPIVPDDQ